MSDTMTGRERLLKALKGEPTDRPSVISACQYATYDLMDAVGASWPEAHRDAELMATLSGKGGAEVIGLDAIRAPYCQTIEAEALGAKIKSGGKTHIPSIAEHPYKVDDVPEFPDDFLTRGRVPVAVKAVSLMKEKYGDQVLVMGGIGGPFSIANSLIGITPFLKAMFKTPDKIQPFLEMGYQAALTFGKAYIEAGADAIVIEYSPLTMESYTNTLDGLFKCLVIVSRPRGPRDNRILHMEPMEMMWRDKHEKYTSFNEQVEYLSHFLDRLEVKEDRISMDDIDKPETTDQR